MFDKLKQLKQLHDLKKQAEAEVATGENNGVTVTIDGTFNLQEIKLNSSLDISAQEKAIKNAFSDAMRKMQMAMAQKFAGLM